MLPEIITVGEKRYDTADLFSVETVERHGGELKLTDTDAEFSFPADITPVDFASAAVSLVGLARDGFIVEPKVYTDAATGLPTVSLPLDDLIGAADEADEDE